MKFSTIFRRAAVLVAEGRATYNSATGEQNVIIAIERAGGKFNRGVLGYFNEAVGWDVGGTYEANGARVLILLLAAEIAESEGL